MATERLRLHATASEDLRDRQITAQRHAIVRDALCLNGAPVFAEMNSLSAFW